MRFLVIAVATSLIYVNSAALVLADNLEKVVAVVNGVELTVADLNQESQKILPRVAGFHRNLSPEKLQEIEKQALASLVEMELQYQDAVAKGIRLNENELDAEMDKLQLKFKSRNDFKKAIEASGFTEKKMLRFVERNLISARIKKMEVDDKVRITEQALLDYYTKNTSKYSKPPEFHIYQILVKVDPAATLEDKAKLKARAESILTKLNKGGDFAKIAEAESDDMYRIKGGDIGYVHEGRLVQEIDDVVKIMHIGETSKVIDSIYGHHIIKLVDRKQPRQMTYEEVKSSINSQFAEQQKESLFKQWMDGLKAKAKISYPKKG